MVDATGRNLTVAGPSYAVEVLGLNMVPMAGDDFQVCESESEVRARCLSLREKET